MPSFTQAQQLLPQDARIKEKRVEIASPHGWGQARGYLVRPARISSRPTST